MGGHHDDVAREQRIAITPGPRQRKRSSQPPARGPRGTGHRLLIALAVLAAAAGGIAAFLVSDGDDEAGPDPPATTLPPSGLTSEQLPAPAPVGVPGAPTTTAARSAAELPAGFAALVGGQLLLATPDAPSPRPIALVSANTSSSVSSAPVSLASTRTGLVVVVGEVVGVGAGAFRVDPSGSTPAALLGAADAVLPGTTDGSVWLIRGRNVRLVEVVTGDEIMSDVAPADVLAALEAGFALQAGNEVLWWRPADGRGTREVTVTVGEGQLASAAGTSLAWHDRRGDLRVFDTATGLSHRLSGDAPIDVDRPISMSPDGSSIAVLRAERVGFYRTSGRSLASVAIAEPLSVAWIDADEVLVSAADGTVRLVEARTGTTTTVARLPFGADAMVVATVAAP